MLGQYELRQRGKPRHWCPLGNHENDGSFPLVLFAPSIGQMHPRSALFSGLWNQAWVPCLEPCQSGRRIQPKFHETFHGSPLRDPVIAIVGFVRVVTSLVVLVPDMACKWMPWYAERRKAWVTQQLGDRSVERVVSYIISNVSKTAPMPMFMSSAVMKSDWIDMSVSDRPNTGLLYCLPLWSRPSCWARIKR